MKAFEIPLFSLPTSTCFPNAVFGLIIIVLPTMSNAIVRRAHLHLKGLRTTDVIGLI